MSITETEKGSSLFLNKKKTTQNTPNFANKRKYVFRNKRLIYALMVDFLWVCFSVISVFRVVFFFFAPQ